MNRARQFICSVGLLVLLGAASSGNAQNNAPTNAGEFRPELLYVGRGNFSNAPARPLRYTPQGRDFVITNGTEFFNRPLYGPNNAFRVDAGDKPELSLYLPGRGGNLRFGLASPYGAKWFNDASQIVARYRPGSMVYELRDRLLPGARPITLIVLPLAEGRGVIIRADLDAADLDLDLVWAFGGANGMKGKRGGDIGCEREPVSRFFQLKPEQCADSDFTIASNTFVLKTKSATLVGTASESARHALADARNWNNLPRLLNDHSATNAEPVVVGRAALRQGKSIYLAIQPRSAEMVPLPAGELFKAFAAAEARRAAVAGRVTVKTPDEFVNAAAAALNVAADAVWDEQQQSFMHGAVAWRQRLLGWRGPYAGDALGWHDRTAAHFTGYARTQNTNEISDHIPGADEEFNLARHENALHSNGDLMNRSHYDMNLVAVDACLRHLLWTGDTNYARAVWPVLQRHLAWERRLFRREFGPDKLPLYEAYAAIWASDDLQYHGGGSTHGSAYNYWHNLMAARVAEMLGEDAAPYALEAARISQGMRQYLWLPLAGTYAEFKDLLGRQLTHDSPALWTFYHTLDCDVASPAEAWSMSKWVDENIAHIPVVTPGVGTNEAQPFVLPTSNWMPYQWSINNVVLAEEAHTSLAFWQANRPEEAFRLFKGFTLDSMFLGLCPGNVGAMTHYDMARGEAQRDFADGCGAMSRALVEGLFGVRPDALAGELKVVPGFPAAWTNALMAHPDFNFIYERHGPREHYHIVPQFPRAMALRLHLPARRDELIHLEVNGQAVQWTRLPSAPGQLRVEVTAPPAKFWDINLEWKGDLVPERTLPRPARAASPVQAESFDWQSPRPDVARLETVTLASVFNDSVTQIFRNDYLSPRSPFCSLAMPKQGIGGWCEPNEKFTVDDAGLRTAAASAGGTIVLPNGVPLATPGKPGEKNIAFVSQWDNYPRELTVPLTGKAARAFLLMAGSSNPMQSRLDNGEVIATYTDGTTNRLALRNPETWWPIDQDYFVDDFAFRLDAPLPVRVDLQTGKVRVLESATFKGRGGKIPGGAATVLTLPLDTTKELKSLTVRALANEVVIGLMSVTLER